MPQIKRFISQPEGGGLSERTALVNRGGEASPLRDVARGVRSLTEGLAEYSDRSERISSHLFDNEAQNFANQMVQDAQDSALNDPEASPDGSSLVTDFEEAFDMGKDLYLEDLSDDRRDRAEQIFEATKLKVRDNLYEKQREQFGKFAIESSERNRRGMSLAVYANPDSFLEEATRMDGMYDTMLAEGLIANPQQLEVIKKTGREEMAIQAIQGEIKKRQFDKATARLIEGDLSLEFSAEKRAKVLEIIDREKMQALESDLKIKKLEADADEMKKKQQQEMVFSNFIRDIGASTRPDVAQKTFEKSTQALAQGLITTEQHRYINSVLNDTKGTFNENLEFVYHDKILRAGGKFDEIQSEIVDSVGKQGMDAKTGNSLLNMLQTRKAALERDPSIKVKFDLAQDFLDASFGKDSFFEPMDQPRKLAKVQATEYMHTLVSQGKDPLEAAKLSTLRFGKPVTALPLVPGIDYKIQSDPNGIMAAKRQLKFMFDQGKMTKDDYAKRIKILNVREQAVNVQIELEQQGRPAPAGGEQ